MSDIIKKPANPDKYPSHKPIVDKSRAYMQPVATEPTILVSEHKKIIESLKKDLITRDNHKDIINKIKREHINNLKSLKSVIIKRLISKIKTNVLDPDPVINFLNSIENN